MVERNECEERIEGVKMKNISKGGIFIKGGEIVIIEGKFEEKHPFFMKYPLLKRNLLCEGEGMEKIENVKGGDGNQENSSLFISSPESDSELEGIVKNHPSLLFIPSVSSIDEPTEENEKIL
jgi:hypothetical protein